jgi:ectoine hydroxylase-related dioxygenase (phytanoyl-CoA dioxygenase family)
VLTDDQVRQYETDGYLLISGLVPPIIAAGADAFLLDLMRSPELNALGHFSREDAELLDCYTPAVISAAAQIVGEDVSTFPFPTRAYAIPSFPTQDEWQWPRPHIDHALKEHGHKTFPCAFRVACMTYLHDVPHHGGGTIVWPGSHRKLLAFAGSDSVKYESMWALNRALKLFDLGGPLELTPQQGDVLFYHYLCAHAGSQNTSDRVRLAFNHKW